MQLQREVEEQQRSDMQCPQLPLLLLLHHRQTLCCSCQLCCAYCPLPVSPSISTRCLACGLWIVRGAAELVSRTSRRWLPGAHSIYCSSSRIHWAEQA